MKNRLLAFGLAAVVLSVPVIAFAAGLVPCGGPGEPACQACYVVSLVNNIIKFLIQIGVVIAVILFAVAGIKLATSGGNASAVSSAKSIFTNVIIGFLILLASWLIIDTVMKVFAKGLQLTTDAPFGVWNEIQCTQQPTGGQPTNNQGGGVAVGGGGGGGTVSPTAGCVNCSTMPNNIPTNGNACSGGGPCQINETMAERLTAIDTKDWRVSEAWPPAGYSASDPSGIHASACHGTATCVDVSFNQNNPSGQTVQGFINEATSNNLTVVYEVPNATRQQQLKNEGVSNVIVVSGINREHFSVYMCDIDSSPNACK